MYRKILIVSALLASSAYVACGGGEETKPGPVTPTTATASTTTAEPTTSTATTTSAEPAKSAEPPPPPKKTAKDIIEGGGTFMFSLADSADAKKLASDDCEKKSKKDAKKLEACMKDVETAGAGEGVRFEKGDKGITWTSFGKEKDKEVIYVKSGVKIAKSDATTATLTPEGKAEGKMAAKAPKEMTIEIPDESTVIVTDPKKGKLVYKKK
jgi:hypothetical protein